MVSNGKRIAYGRNQNRVNTTTYPDDTSVPVRTTHWNQDPHDQAILGFTKITATLDSSGVIYTKDDTTTFVEDDGSTYSKQSTLIEVECEGVTTTDAVVKIDITDTNENDIIYLFKGTAGDDITISSITPSADGHIKTQLSGGATLVHDGVPIMLIRRGDYWYEFGADGAAVTAYTAPTIGSTSIASGSTNATIAGLTLTSPVLGTVAAGSILTNATGLPATTGLTATGTKSSGTYLRGDDTWAAVSSYTAPIIGSTSIASGSTNATIAGLTLTAPVLGTPAAGSVLTNCTGLPATTGLTATGTKDATTFLRGDDTWAVVNATPDMNDLADVTGGSATGTMLYKSSGDWIALTSSGHGGKTLQMNAGATAPEWITVAGAGASQIHKFSNAGSVTTYAGLTGESQTLGTAATDGTNGIGLGDRDVYIRKIDANNEGVFTVIHKNGALVEVQIAQVD